MKDITSMYKSRLASLLFLLPLLFGMQEAKAAEIDASPCDAQATAQTKALYRYLRDEVWGKKVLSGCQALWDYNTTEAEKIQGYCGKFPAINVFDFQHYIDSEKGVNWINYHETKARDWQNNGGIVGFMWHWNVPVNVFSEDMGWYGFYAPGGGNSITYMSPAKAMEEGTIEHRIINRELDIIAKYLLEYQSQGVAVLWRPLHEAAGNTNTYNNGKAWFWWGTDGAEAFKKLYEKFNVMENNEILEVWAGIISWKSWFESFSVANSKSSFLLQTADVLATSVMKTLEKVFSDRDLNEYDGFVKTLIKEMLEDDTFFFVMSDRNVRKLAQIMAASPHASM